jgi:hypothetical protein
MIYLMPLTDLTFIMQPDVTKLCNFVAYTVLNVRCLYLVARVVKEKIADVTLKIFKCKC